MKYTVVTMTTFVFAMSIMVAGCDKEHATRTVSWYESHTSDLKTKLKQCEDNPGDLSNTADCVNAEATKFQLHNTPAPWTRKEYKAFGKKTRMVEFDIAMYRLGLQEHDSKKTRSGKNDAKTALQEMLDKALSSALYIDSKIPSFKKFYVAANWCISNIDRNSTRMQDNHCEKNLNESADILELDIQFEMSKVSDRKP